MRGSFALKTSQFSIIMIHQRTHKHRNKSAKASAKTEIYLFAVRPNFRRFIKEIAGKSFRPSIHDAMQCGARIKHLSTYITTSILVENF